MRIKNRKLKQLIKVAAQMQENEHNSPEAPSSNHAIEDVERKAAELGYSTEWPGIYPVFSDKENNKIYVE